MPAVIFLYDFITISTKVENCGKNDLLCFFLCIGKTSHSLMSTTVKLAHGSRFMVHDSQFTVHDSRFTIHGSRFTVHDSQFTVHDSRFTVHDSQFTVHGS